MLQTQLQFYEQQFAGLQSFINDNGVAIINQDILPAVKEICSSIRSNQR